MASDGTHISNIQGSVKLATTAPSSPVIGDEYYDTSTNVWYRWSGDNWMGLQFTTSSTSTTTTTSTSTSTSTTTTSTSSSTTTSTSTSTTTTG
jgi:hypothetical protein